MIPANRQNRLIAIFLDFILLVIIPPIPVYIFVWRWNSDINDLSFNTLITVQTAECLIFLILSLPEALLGRSIGMRIVGTAVGDRNGSLDRPSAKLLACWSIKYCVLLVFLCETFAAFNYAAFHLKLSKSFLERSLPVGLIAGGIALVISFVDVAIFFISRGRTTLHDAVAGTMAWNLRKGVQSAGVHFAEPMEADSSRARSQGILNYNSPNGSSIE